jgi:ABC-type maltose transport system permease subunit
MKNTKKIIRQQVMTLFGLIVVVLVLLSLISILFIGTKALKEGSDKAIAKREAQKRAQLEEYSVIFEKTKTVKSLPVSITVQKRVAEPQYKINISVFDGPNKITASTPPLYLTDDEGRPILETKPVLSEILVVINDEWVSFGVSESGLTAMTKTRAADTTSFKEVAKRNQQHLIKTIEDILGPKEKVVATEMFLAE